MVTRMMRQNYFILAALILFVSVSSQLIAQSPQISNQTVRSRHWGSSGPAVIEAWGVDVWVFVTDPQGLGDIDSIWVDGPSGFHARLYDDGKNYDNKANDGHYARWIGGLSSPPARGGYYFRARDKSGNLVSATDTLTAILDYPRNVTPQYNAVVSIPGFTISWDKVAGATGYYVDVKKPDWSHTFWSYSLDSSQLSTKYNFNNSGEGLTDGGSYILYILASDVNSNQSERLNVRFAYSTNPTSPILADHKIVTYHGGDDRGGEDYGYDYWIDVTDPQGLSDILSVTMTTPDGLRYPLYDDATRGDGTAGDGRYSGYVRGLSRATSLGQCRFVVTDKSNNTATVFDTLSAWVPFARNVRPAYNEVVQTSLPTLRWDAVAGVTYYQIHFGISNRPFFWGGINVVNRTSITYNENGTGQDLLDGKRYWWDLRAFDDKGNYGFHYATEFTYSTNPTSPVLSNPSARSGHYGRDSGNESYVLCLAIQAADPQGLTDIASVVVTGPGGETYTTKDDNNDGYYDTYFGGLTSPPQVGAYKFRVTDKSGNWAEALDTLTAVLDYPRNVRPTHNEVVMSSTPTFSWSAVQGATGYYVWVNDATGKQIWSRYNVKTTSVVYNDDGTAKAGLKDGSTYTCAVGANDADNNWSEQNPKFTYSTNPTSPVLAGHKAVTYHGGDDRGGEDFGYDYWIEVTDPQGLSDIASVTLTTPDGLTYQLYDDATRGDGTAGDGRYSGYVRGLSKASSLGQCRFVVTDKSDNTATVFDTLSAWMPYARNVRPAYNDVVQTSFPVFHWDSVVGISSYTLRVIEGGTELWWINVKNRTSVIYNENGTGPNLQDGKRYWWDLYAYDVKGNYGYHYGTYFTYSSSSTSPVLSNPSAHSAHYGDDKGNFEYKLTLGIQVADPQGLSDIASVRVTGPSGKTYTITDDNNDGWYETWFGGLTQPPELGAYGFRATDKSGNWAEAVDTVAAVMDYPRNVRPTNNEVVSSSTPTFSWNAVQGATRYYVWVNDATGKQIWRRDNLITTSVGYNDDGMAKASLRDGGMYTWAVGVLDAHSNWGEQDTKFTYSTNPSSPNVGGHKAVTYHGGDDRGSEDFGYDYWIDATDPQGLSDIVSVTLTTPDGLTYPLYDDATRGDGVAGDGRYSGYVRGLSKASSLGQCRFVVTDRSNNTATVFDTLSAWVPFVRNVRPANNDVVNTSAPTFSWGAIAGVSSYTLLVYNFIGSQIWSMNTDNRTSVTYNENGTGQSLEDGKSYTWYLYAWDPRGNYGYHYGTAFTFSTNPTSPIVGNPTVRSRHWVQGDFSESWGIDCWVNVTDPQGLNDIDSSWVDGPNGFHVRLYDDGNHSDNSAQDGKYAYWISGLSTPPIMGEYKFKVIDKSGNLVTTRDTLAAVIDYPKKVAPQHNAVVSIPSFTMSWDKVQGADWYEAKILTSDWSKQLWSSGRRTNLTSIQYNADGAGEQLTEGGIYYMVIWAGDKQYDGNEAERAGVKIAYRLNNRRVVYVDSSNTSGNENGTVKLPFNSIREALVASVRGDTVSVAMGTYNENVFPTDGVALLGKTPVSTRINGFVSIGAGLSNVVVSGFTISCVTQSCVDIVTSSVIITNNIILDSPHVGVNIRSGSSPTIINNTIVGNGGGISASSAGSSVKIHNNIIYGNKGTGVDFANGNPAQFRYNDVFGNPTPYSGITPGEGNIFVSPRFVDSSKKDYRLSSNSPCIDGGTPDLDGDGIIWINDPADRDPDGTRMDMGALYFDQRVLYPAAPRNLAVIPADHKVGIRWSPNSEFNISHYKIYRSVLYGFTPTYRDSIASVFKPDTSYVDQDVTNGQMYYYRISAVNIVGNESPASEQVNTIPGKLTSPILVSPLNNAINQWISLMLTWNPSATAIFYHLQVSTDSGFTATLINDSTITGTTKQIGPLTFNSRFYWRVCAKSMADKTPFSPTWQFTTVPVYPATLTISTTMSFPTKATANAYATSDYRVIGLPGSSDILGKDIVTGVQNEDWEIVWDNGAASDYLKRYDGSNDFKFTAGKAFWIISKALLSINRTVPSATLNAAQEVEIPVRSGWNLITNPFDKSIPWTRIQTTNGITGAIYSFNGAFNNSTTFDPYAGYYFFNGTPSPVLTTLRVPYSSAFGK